VSPRSLEGFSASVRGFGKEPLNTTELIKDLARVKRKQAPLWEEMRRRNHKHSIKVRGCGSYLELREWLEHDGQCTVQTANFCKKSVICNLCAIRRSAKLCKAYEAKILEVLSDPHHVNLKPVMITLTVKNEDDCRERFLHLKHSFRKLTRKASDYKRRKNKEGAPPEFCKVSGGVYSYEVKRGRGGKWHPHLHIFALLENWIDCEALSQEWEEVTGDSKIIDVRECQGGILKGLIEVLKYTTKFSEMSPADILTVEETVQGATLVNPLGILRGVQVEELDHDEQLDGDFIDYIALFMYQKNGYRLKLKRELHDDDEPSAEGARRIEEEREILKKARMCV